MGHDFPSAFLDAIDRAVLGRDGKRERGEFRFRCPAEGHPDEHPSARWNREKATWYCDACTAGGGALDVAERLGVPRPETIRHNGHGQHRLCVGDRRYPLLDQTGQVIAIHVRKDFSDGTKDMPWELPDGTSGLGGRKVTDLPLYGVHELNGATESVVVEGEKSRDALAALGITAVGTVTGAKATPSDDTIRSLIGLAITLWPDADEQGTEHMQRIARRLLALGQPRERIRVAVWPDAPLKGDAADFVANGATAEDVRRLIAVAEPVTDDRDQQSKDTTDWEAPAGRLRFLTARQFAHDTPAQTDWVIPPFVPAGGVTKIDGPPKKAGKTTLITHMIAAVINDDRSFLGKPTRHGPVILLTEQGGTSFREALARAQLLDRDDLYIAVYRDIASLAWPDVVAQTFALAQEVGAVLVVVDTFPQVSRVRGDDENSAGHALAALEPLQIGADHHRLGVIVSFHDRKGGGEVGESGRGSSAYAGAVDVILHVNRPGGNLKPTVRKIEALSRFEATPEELYIELTDAGYISLGTEDDIVTAMVMQALAAVLPRTEHEAKPVSSLKRRGEDGEEEIEPGILDGLTSQGVKAARSTVDAELARWLKAGYAARSGEGKRGSPFRYWLIAEPPDAFLRSKPSGSSEERNGGPSPTGDERADGDQKVASDASSPSEETNVEPADRTCDDPILSSDGLDAYIGGKQSEEPAAGQVEEI
ncbi:MAG: AAA family ATPase [Thermomicrobiales bacterium]